MLYEQRLGGEPLVSAHAISKEISKILELPVGDVGHRTVEILYWMRDKIRKDLDIMLNEMEREEQERTIRIEDAYGSPDHVKLVPNYRSIENMPEFIKEEELSENDKNIIQEIAMRLDERSKEEGF